MNKDLKRLLELYINYDYDFNYNDDEEKKELESLKSKISHILDNSKCDHSNVYRNYILDQKESNTQSKVDVCMGCNRVLLEGE